MGGYVGPVTQRSVPVDAYIIGAGPGGLAVAAALEARGLHGVVLERSHGVGVVADAVAPLEDHAVQATGFEGGGDGQATGAGSDDVRVDRDAALGHRPNVAAHPRQFSANPAPIRTVGSMLER